MRGCLVKQENDYGCGNSNAFLDPPPLLGLEIAYLLRVYYPYISTKPINHTSTIEINAIFNTHTFKPNTSK